MRVGKMSQGGWLWCVCALHFASGCSPQRMVTVEFPDKDENTNYWVCEPDENLENPRNNTHCRGRLEGDLNDTDYSPGLHTVAGIEECQFGIARMEILTKGSRVEQIGFMCASRTEPEGGQDAPPPEPEGGQDAPPPEPEGGQDAPPPEPEGGQDVPPPEPTSEGNSNAGPKKEGTVHADI